MGKSISTSSLRDSSAATTTTTSSSHLRSAATRNNAASSNSRMTNNSSSSANLRRTSSVDNLSSRPNILAKYTQQQSSPTSRDRPRYDRGDSGRGGGAALPPRDAHNDRYAEPASSVKSGETFDYYYNMLRFES